MKNLVSGLAEGTEGWLGDREGGKTGGGRLRLDNVVGVRVGGGRWVDHGCVDNLVVTLLAKNQTITDVGAKAEQEETRSEALAG